MVVAGVYRDLPRLCFADELSEFGRCAFAGVAVDLVVELFLFDRFNVEVADYGCSFSVLLDDGCGAPG